MVVGIEFWIGFLVFLALMLALDLGVFHRDAHVVSFKEACGWSAVWVTLALIFNLGIYFYFGAQPALEFLTGYVVEYSLSVDNIFVFVMLFTFFAVPPQYQHRVLFWGILGALAMRGALIFLGAALIKEYQWIVYIFGAFLIFTGIKMFFASDKPQDLNQNPILKFCRRHLRVTDNYVGQKFFVRQNGLLYVTPLFLVLVMVEMTDLIFAVDSIPAILAITQDPFIVFTSNAFAIMGLRSMYFMLSGVVHMFRYLKTGLSFVLVFIGTKMTMMAFYKIPTMVSLTVVVSILSIAIIASIMANRRDKLAANS